MANIPALHQLSNRMQRAMAEACANNILLPTFVAKRKPAISIEQYVSKVVNQSECSEACFIYATVLIERLIAKGVCINEFNVHRITLVLLMEAAKFNDDVFYDNSSFAVIGGVSNEELNALELEFLILMDFDVMVSYEEFDRKYQLCKP